MPWAVTILVDGDVWGGLLYALQCLLVEQVRVGSSRELTAVREGEG